MNLNVAYSGGLITCTISPNTANLPDRSAYEESATNSIKKCYINMLTGANDATFFIDMSFGTQQNPRAYNHSWGDLTLQTQRNERAFARALESSEFVEYEWKKKRLFLLSKNDTCSVINQISKDIIFEILKVNTSLPKFSLAQCISDYHRRRDEDLCERCAIF